MSDAERRRLSDQMNLLRASLMDAEREHAAGELDEASYAAITERDGDRLAELGAALDHLPPPAPSSTTPGPAPSADLPGDDDEKPPARRSRRVWLLILGLVLVTLAGAVVLANVLSRTTAAPTSTAAEVATLLNQADVKVSSGDIAGGLATYRAVLALDPTQPQALAETGWLSFEAGVATHSASVIAQAEADVRAAIQAAPNYYAPRLYLGVIELLANEDPAAALVQFRQFEALSPPARWRQTAEPYIAKATAELGATTTTAPAG